MKRNAIRLFLAAAAAAFLFAAHTRSGGQSPPSTPRKAQAPRTARLYVFDCGVLHNSDMGRFNLKAEDVTTTDMSMGCFLVAHPKGNLIWDTGAVPDDSWTPTGHMITQHITLAGRQYARRGHEQDRFAGSSRKSATPLPTSTTSRSRTTITITRPTQTSSRARRGSCGKSNATRCLEENVSGTVQPSTFSALQKSKTIIIKTDEYDVFGDGSVILKSAPGHTQGHQVLYVKLAKTGGVVLSGDLYHYPAEMTLKRVPTFEFSQDQTRASRVAVDAFLKKTSSQLWIQHDFVGIAKLNKSPQFYE